MLERCPERSDRPITLSNRPRPAGGIDADVVPPAAAGETFNAEAASATDQIKSALGNGSARVCQTRRYRRTASFRGQKCCRHDRLSEREREREAEPTAAVIAERLPNPRAHGTGEKPIARIIASSRP